MNDLDAMNSHRGASCDPAALNWRPPPGESARPAHQPSTVSTAPGSSTSGTPVVGELYLSYEVMELPADPGLALVAFSAEAGSPADDALRFLASWAATHAPAEALAAPTQM